MGVLGCISVELLLRDLTVHETTYNLMPGSFHGTYTVQFHHRPLDAKSFE